MQSARSSCRRSSGERCRAKRRAKRTSRVVRAAVARARASCCASRVAATSIGGEAGLAEPPAGGGVGSYLESQRGRDRGPKALSAHPRLRL